MELSNDMFLILVLGALSVNAVLAIYTGLKTQNIDKFEAAVFASIGAIMIVMEFVTFRKEMVDTLRIIVFVVLAIITAYNLYKING